MKNGIRVSVQTNKANTEKQKFKRFYLFGTVFWCLTVILFFLSEGWVSSPDLGAGVKTFANNMRGIMLTFVIFGIPIIFLLSFIIIIAEPIMDKVKAYVDQKNAK